MTKIEYRNALLQDASGKSEFCVHSSDLSFESGSYIRLPNGIEYYAVREPLYPKVRGGKYADCVPMGMYRLFERNDDHWLLKID